MNERVERRADRYVERWSATGDYKKASSYAKQALAQAPDEGNKTNLERMITKLDEGKDIN